MRRIQRWPVNSPHKGPVKRKMFPFDDVVMQYAIFFHLPYFHVINSAVFFGKYSGTLLLHWRSLDAYIDASYGLWPVQPVQPVQPKPELMLITVETLYNTVNFCWSTHKRHSIARPKGRGMGCLLWVQRATYCVDLSKLSSIKYLL